MADCNNGVVVVANKNDNALPKEPDTQINKKLKTIINYPGGRARL